jgi:N-acetylglucosaminyldiphosphoundecaprenol N-acetyl-beta-D-mannosaminyltransferase
MYRLLREPRRLWRRYLLFNPLYMMLLFLQAIGWHRIAAEHNPAPAQELRYG